MSLRLGERIEGWPWAKTVTMVGIYSYLMIQAVTGTIILVMLLWHQFQPLEAQAWLVDRMIRVHDTAIDASLWAMGIGGSFQVGKRATEKPEIVKAEAEAKAKTVLAEASAKKTLLGDSAPEQMDPILVEIALNQQPGANDDESD